MLKKKGALYLCTQKSVTPQRPVEVLVLAFTYLSCLLFLCFFPLNFELNTSSAVSVYHKYLNKEEKPQLSVQVFHLYDTKYPHIGEIS